MASEATFLESLDSPAPPVAGLASPPLYLRPRVLSFFAQPLQDAASELGSLLLP